MLLNIFELETKEYYERLRLLAGKRSRHHCLGFWGQPDQAAMDIFSQNGYTFIDLDIPRPDNICPAFVPQTTCQIIQVILANACALRERLDFILAATGPDKCEQGRQTAEILESLDFPVINASNTNKTPLRPSLISNARGPLGPRVSRIMELAYRPLAKEEEIYYQSRQIKEAEVIFHGVPPADLSLLELFPDNTRIEGWTKLVELGVPGRVDLEWRIAPQLPVVFFTQSFCHKGLLAAYLAKSTGGLHIEGHGAITGSTEAKLQAYLGLAGKTFQRGPQP